MRRKPSWSANPVTRGPIPLSRRNRGEPRAGKPSAGTDRVPIGTVPVEVVLGEYRFGEDTLRLVVNDPDTLLRLRESSTKRMQSSSSISEGTRTRTRRRPRRTELGSVLSRAEPCRNPPVPHQPTRLEGPMTDWRKRPPEAGLPCPSQPLGCGWRGLSVSCPTVEQATMAAVQYLRDCGLPERQRFMPCWTGFRRVSGFHGLAPTRSCRACPPVYRASPRSRRMPLRQGCFGFGHVARGGSSGRSLSS